CFLNDGAVPTSISGTDAFAFSTTTGSCSNVRFSISSIKSVTEACSLGESSPTVTICALEKSLVPPICILQLYSTKINTTTVINNTCLIFFTMLYSIIFWLFTINCNLGFVLTHHFSQFRQRE